MINEQNFIYHKSRENPQYLFENWYNNAKEFHFKTNNILFDLILWFVRFALKFSIKLFPELNELFSRDIVALGTVDKEAKPKVRMVLFKGLYDGNFSFFSNYDSDKGIELENNPRVSMTFYFRFPPRQIRIEGQVEKMNTNDSDAYWKSRGRDSRIGAIVSKQSRPLKNYEQLVEDFMNEKENVIGTENIARPENWGGYLIKPTIIEFWEGKANRLHDRYRFKFMDGSWFKTHLYP
ncbi:pyridoxamine 5'-phosphate oxidase [Bacteriovoracaceae bacterium]|nr:pyridoxamine 5'-phosphate oxidase [Bacteriovoracaceae bacterium]